MTINFKSTAKIKLIKNCISDIEKVRLNLNDYECDSGYKRIINTSLISKIRGLQNKKGPACCEALSREC